MRPSSMGGRLGRLVVLSLALVACGKSTSGPSEVTNAFLFQHNASENDGLTARWTQIPIPVFANGVGDEDDAAPWTSASGGLVTFAFVGSSPSSGITVSFRSLSGLCGLTTTTLVDDRITSAEILISTRRSGCSSVGSIVTHEIGHAIGFFGHTNDGGLMDDDGGNGRITGQVSAMITTLYSLAAGTPISFALKPKQSPRASGRRYTVTSVTPARP